MKKIVLNINYYECNVSDFPEDFKIFYPSGGENVYYNQLLKNIIIN